MPAITRLAMTDFRSYAALEIAAAPGTIVITGENGAGKTNILDAISLLGPSRGLRGAALSDAARSGGPGGWSVAATLLAEGADVELGTGTAAAAPSAGSCGSMARRRRRRRWANGWRSSG